MLMTGDAERRVLWVEGATDPNDARKIWSEATGEPSGRAHATPAGWHISHPHAGQQDLDSSTPSIYLCALLGPDAGLITRLPRGRSGIGRPSESNTPRVVLRSRTVARDHASIDVSADGVLISARSAPVWVNGKRIRQPQRITEQDSITLGANSLRILATLPQAPPTPTGTALEFVCSIADLPRKPWAALAACLLPSLVGFGLWSLTGQWYMLLLSALGLATAGPGALTDLVRRRRALRSIRASAARAALAFSSAFPAPGELLASWLAPTTSVRAETLTVHPHTAPENEDKLRHRFSACVGVLHGERVELRPDAGPARLGRIKVSRIPAVLTPAPGETIVIVGTPEQAAPATRAVVAWWVERLRPKDELEVSRTLALPAQLVLVPGVRLADLPPGVIARVRSGTARSGSREEWVTLENRTPRDLLEEDLPANQWLVNVDQSLLSRSSRQSTLVSSGPALEAFSFALRARLSRVISTSRPTGSLHPAADLERRVRGDSLGVRLGEPHDDVALIDIVSDGPHALVAGTTGAGKSELLRSWILRLVEEHSPHELSLVLFDFKGGATFGPFAPLPHCQAMVTDLDAETTERVLAALGSEVRRREAWLAEQGSPDFESAAHQPGRPPRLLVCVDEFRVLREEVPEAMDRLIRLATVGRSLGIHLLLSTQRPQGSVSADILANVSLTICLRVASASESIELLGHAAAYQLPASEPGSAWVRRGGSEAEQTRFLPVEGQRARQPQWIGPSLAHNCDAGIEVPPRRRFAQRLAAVCQRGLATASGTDGLRPLIPASLPLEPTRISVNQKTRGLLLGLGEDASFAPEPLVWDPRLQGGMAILTGHGSELHAVGRGLVTTLLKHPTFSRNAVIVNGLPGGPDWSRAIPSSALPHRQNGDSEAFGPLAYAVAGDGAWIDEVLEALALGHHHRHAARTPEDPVLLCLLGWEALAVGAATSEGVRREGLIKRVLADRAVVPLFLGGRSLAGSHWLQHTPQRIFLPFGAGPESTHLWPRIVPTSPVSGRGALIRPGGSGQGTRVQLLVPQGVQGVESTEGEVQECATRSPSASSASSEPARAARPLWVPPPATVPSAALGPGAHAVTSVDGRHVAWEPRRGAGLIIGGPGSGKTSLLRLLASSLSEASQVWSASGEEPPLEDWALIDEADRWPRDRSYAVAERLRRGGLVLATATASPRLPLALAWFADLDPIEDLILLGPRSPYEAQAVPWHVPVDAAAPAGRGWYHPRASSVPVRVQWATPGVNQVSPAGGA